MAKSEQQKEKEKLDAIFSKYIRWKHADENGYCTCFTCGKVKHVKKIQNGHFIPRNILITRFDENNCRPQCAGCNLFGNGKFVDFRENLVKELGEDKVKEMEASRFKTMKVDVHWYKEQIEKYKKLVKQYTTE